MAAPALHVALLAAVLLIPFLSVPAEAQTKKFCLTQFAIASQACAILPPTSPEHHHHDDDDEDNDEDEDEDNDEDEDEDNDDSGGGGGGGDRRRARNQEKMKSGLVSKPASKSGSVAASTAHARVVDDHRRGG